MQKFWFYIYNVLFLPFFWVVMQCAALFNPKIWRGISGRRGLFQHLAQDISKLRSGRRVWFHSSSMGEFEQAKPIIAALRRRHKDIDIVVTFFSPSGYDHSKNYKLANLISYIPFDTVANASRFLDMVRPTVAVMVRYDVWPNHMWELRKRGIPTFIANATLRKNSLRRVFPLSSFHRYVYDGLRSILTVSNDDAEAFKAFGLTQPEIQSIGETRYDQVSQRSEDAKAKHLIPLHILTRKKVFVVGSSWEEDDNVILPAFKTIAQEDKSAVMILVPHEPTLETLERLEISLNGSLRTIRFSELNDFSNENVILVDSVGVLMSLYQYADIAYVGGSFKQGIHNVLEPAVYGVPVVYGPKHENSREAVELAGRGAGFIVQNTTDCYRTLKHLLVNEKARKKSGAEALRLVRQNTGATARFLKHLEEVL
ncbi:MAG: 3-deoxy-D-manno-octulosonic acid transferase [Ignavibacteriales bacterium]|nr:3-deoxy-D-manno-octulosonic acid transferase [Ignavibacteriales bacterium]